MKINRNIFWSELFVEELVSSGVKYACISPGSRSTSLNLAFAKHEKIKSFSHIDERSGGFFALGLAKQSNSPVALICTSGTATAEFYPAIIEAYNQRVPLIVCTADRSPELQNVGANQTINQENIFKNHIRWFANVGLPELSIEQLKNIKLIARRAVYEAVAKSRGPVHLNFPFNKPFEPHLFTDEISQDFFESAVNSKIKKFDLEKSVSQTIGNKKLNEVLSLIQSKKKGLIIVGPNNYDKKFIAKINYLAKTLSYPILADVASQLRFNSEEKINVITNYDALLRNSKLKKYYESDFILQFGRTTTSKGLEIYLEETSATRIIINQYGDWFDPSNNASEAIACDPIIFCEQLISLLGKSDIPKNHKWLNLFLDSDSKAAAIRKKIIDKIEFINESKFVNQFLNLLPENINLMLSNSMPIREFDYFASKRNKNIHVHQNRGASGIDGINSTALGIAATSEIPTLLVTGDLSFYHDLNGLIAAKKYKIPLIIILINNNGGGIFEILPIASYGKVFEEFFLTPTNLEFKNFVKAYSGNYSLVKTWQQLEIELEKAFKKNTFSVLELKTDAKKSFSLKNEYWKKLESLKL